MMFGNIYFIFYNVNQIVTLDWNTNVQSRFFLNFFIVLDMVYFASSFLSSSVNSLQSDEDLTCNKCMGEQLVVDVDGSYKEISLSECSDSINKLLATLQRPDVEGLDFLMVSCLNGDVEIDLYDGFKGDNAFSVDFSLVWTALLLNLYVSMA